MREKYKQILCAGAVVLMTVLIAVAAAFQGRNLKTSEPAAVISEEETVTQTEPTTEPPRDSLVITSPTENPLTVEQPYVTISGICAPELPLTVNGQAVELAADGAFAYECPLNVGENKIVVDNTEKSVELTVKYERKLLRAVTPKNKVSADGGMTLEVTAEALENAKVTVKLSGAAVSLSPIADSGDGSGFLTYTGKVTLPAGKYEKQSLGKLRFTAALDGQTQTMSGASVTVNAIKYEDIPIDVGQGVVKPPVISGEGKVEVLSPETDFGKGTARVLRVTTDYAETVPGNTADDKSSPLCTPFPRGTYDYITGEGVFDGKSYYITKSGYKVEQEDSKSFDGYVLPSNTISTYKSYTDGESHVILTMNWQVPFVSETKPQKYYKGYAGRVFNVASSTAEYIDFKFYYTNAAEGNFDFSGSNVVKAAEWRDIGKDGTTTLRVYLRKSGRFCGYRTYYSSDNRLVISFRNKPKSVNRAVVAIDPGHGGKDSGAIGANGVYESTLNLRISAILKQKLEAQGIRVVIFRTGDSTLDLDERQRMAREAGADAFICLHNNSSSSKKMSGTEVYYYRAFSQPLAASIHAQLATAWKDIYKNDAYMRDRVVSSDGGVRFYPFRTTRIEECPAVLAECGYLSNATECSAVCDPVNQEKIAEAVCRGVVGYLKKG